jgi:hypothetical protein
MGINSQDDTQFAQTGIEKAAIHGMTASVSGK